MRNVPAKNYIIVLLLAICTFFLAFILTKFYYELKKIRMEIHTDFASDILENELDSYIIESHDVMIYVTNSQTLDMDTNKKLRSVIENGDYSNDIIHFDMTNATKQLKDIFQKYNNKNYELIENSLLIIKNEKIVNVVDLSKSKSYIKNHIVYYYGE